MRPTPRAALGFRRVAVLLLAVYIALIAGALLGALANALRHG